jgi:hypothetical protein
MSFKLREIDRGFDRLRALADAVAKEDHYAKAGVLEGNAKRVGDKKDELTNVELALIHEFGSPKANIPERSFIRGPFNANLQKYGEVMRGYVKRLYENRLPVMQLLGLMGLRMANDMKAAIRTSSGGNEPMVPNAKSTIAKKGSSRPLVDTGQLLKSITWAVVKGTGKKDAGEIAGAG